MWMLILLASCSYTPEERAVEAVKDYCSALKDNDWEKKSALTYDEISAEEVCESASDEEPLKSDLELKIPRLCVITKDSKIKILNVETIYQNVTLLREFEGKEYTEEGTDETIEAGESTEAEAYAPEPVEVWPSNVAAAFKVIVEAEDNRPIFTVVQVGKKDFRIYSTKGLYKYDFNEVKKKLGFEPEFPDDVDDHTMEQNVYDFVANIQTFDILSKAVAANDSSKIVRVFPQLNNNNYDYKFKGTPVAKNYSMSGRYGVIATTDSLAFKISPEGKIADCYGVISVKKAEDAVKALGGTPYERGDKFDIEYIDALDRQVISINYEKERQAKAAKYKAQGLALVSSQMSSDGRGAKGVKFAVLNTSNKTAKYAIMEVVGYNAVDDPVWSNGYLKKCRGIGPFESGQVCEWDFDNIWEDGDIVRSYEIKTLTLQYTDGTSKSIKLPRSLPSDWKSWLY